MEIGLNFMLRTVRAGLKRHFTELAAAGSQHYTIPEVTLSGDFEIEFEFSTTDTGVVMITGRDAASSPSIWVNNGVVNSRDADATTTITVASSYNDGKLHAVKVSRSGTTHTLTVDGVAVSSTVSVNSYEINTIGVRQTTAFYFNGIISNVKITDAGTLVRHYKINETWANDLVLKDVSGNAQHGAAVNVTAADSERYTFNKQDNAWLGGELVTNGGFDADTDWNKDAGWTISGGLANLAGNGTPDGLRQNDVMTVGLKYSYGFNPVADSSAIGFQDSLGVLVDSGSDGARVSGSFTTDTTYLLFKRASGTVNGSIDNVSFKRLIEVA